MNKKARDLLVSILKQPIVWPGGYERLLVIEDGGLLCHNCCRKEAKRIMSDIRDGYNTGWFPVTSVYEAVCCEDTEEMLHICDNCYAHFGELCN